MSTVLPNWERSHYIPGNGRALIIFTIYGEFSRTVSISQSEYYTTGLPQGFSIHKVERKDNVPLPFTDETYGKGIRDKGLFARICTASECMKVYGEIPDSPDLNYLRDVVGIVTYFMDYGGFAVCDPQLLEVYDRERWRRDIFEPSTLSPLKHVVILYSDESNGRWCHTRGLRKFARPDISVRNVPFAYTNAVVEMLHRFICFQVLGGRIKAGEEIRMASLPPGLICKHEGSLDDPDYNNVHVEITWPG